MSTYRNTSWLPVLVLVALWTCCGCSSSAPDDPTKRDPKLSPKVEKLLRIVEDDNTEPIKRDDAVEELARTKETSAVPRLLKLLIPGKNDRLTLTIIRGLEDIGDPRALPVLRGMKKPGKNYTGKINAALRAAIEALEEISGSP